MTNIYLGTSSWNFDEWRGAFYPDKLAKSKYLSHYAQQFCTVEVNTSFYALPRPSTLINWLDNVPKRFTFALKVPRQISHQKRLIDCESETLAYLDAVRSLGDAAAPGLLQLPPDFSRQNYGRILANYLDWFSGQLDGVRMAVEVRAPDLMTPAFASFLAERGFALVLVDREGTPDLFPIWWDLVEQSCVPNFGFIRWIGDDKNGPTGNRELSAPRDEALERWAKRLSQLHSAQIDLFGYMHNPYEGHSPASLRRLQSKLEAYVDLPPWAPPTSGTDSDAPAQLSLFGG